ncbi:MAG: TRAP transporter large permease subunit, partial [Gammaproteobacteria bacterium]|nr:TRAP transporter large permease subunit [Gammaproteobacteria bacterium]
DKSYALGVIAGSGSLGMLIPPSVLLIVWAILTEVSVGALFLAGVIPGLLLGLVFVIYCIVWAIRHPDRVPVVIEEEAPDGPGQKRSEKISGLGIILLIFLVLGGIWAGVFTPTEAAGFGVAGSIVLGFAKGMGRKEFIEATLDAGRFTAPVMFLLIAGSMYAKLLAVSGGLDMIQTLLTDTGFGPIGLVAIMTVVWLLLGALIDSISDILLTVPIFVPMAMAVGIDPIAFAIYGIIIIEAGLLTPPLGLLVFTVKSSVPDSSVTLSEIFIGAVPYWLLMLFVAVLVIVFPELATWLPGLMF